MEKKFLQKETKKLKNLNSHLDSRLGEQEQRLGAVTIELNKTWNLVGRMQRQHRQLHTHEQVLRYQLQQKRRMLSELKEELEYCRRKWALAKEKNNESQTQWETLRLEFSKRKESDLNISGESGYSDSPASEEDEEDSSATIGKSRTSRLKKKLNMENFLLNSDKDRKTIRIHSVSPVRNVKVNISRSNSESHVTQYATEVFQATSDVVQPIVHEVCAECGENCVKHTVHFDTESQKSTDQVKVLEAVIHNATHEPSHAQKLVESKASSSKTKMSCELRKITSNKSSASKTEESLEEMFLRLSGSTESSQTHGNVRDTQTTNIDSLPSTSNSQEEQQHRRIARIERLEEQCKVLLEQVTRASNRGDELKKRINEVHDRYTPSRDTTPSEKQQNEMNQPQPSTSTMENSPKSDEQCLSATEKEYLLRRDERLKRLESDSKSHIDKVKSINRRATDVDTKLEFLHGRFGSDAETGESSKQNDKTIAIDQQPAKVLEASTLKEEKPETSIKSDEECLSATERQYLSRRDERLKRLEAESQAFLNRMKSANQSATDVDTKLERLHIQYGSETTDEQNVSNSTSNLDDSQSIPQNQNERIQPNASPSDDDANNQEQ